MQIRNYLAEDPRYWYITGYERATPEELARVYVESMEQGLDITDLMHELDNRNISLNELETIYESLATCTCHDDDAWRECPLHSVGSTY